MHLKIIKLKETEEARGRASPKIIWLILSYNLGLKIKPFD